MPIRFRCAYCNQLMGIAKRKAGQVVTCPKCGGQVVVPTPDPAMEEEERNAGNPAAAFEEDDEVQKLLEFVEETKPAPAAGAMAVRPIPAPAAQQVLPMPHVAAQRAAQQPTAPPPAVPRPAAPQPGAPPPGAARPGAPQPGAPGRGAGLINPAEIDVEPMGALVPARGVHLTPAVLSILLVLVGLLLGLAFFLGFLLGRSTVG
ncbi:MAG: hypothetical protein L0Y71_01240 [Gemmataceae bacterium]|nr:hypothetical protein [Gemmataceae bacterium]